MAPTLGLWQLAQVAQNRSKTGFARPEGGTSQPAAEAPHPSRQTFSSMRIAGHPYGSPGAKRAYGGTGRPLPTGNKTALEKLTAPFLESSLASAAVQSSANGGDRAKQTPAGEIRRSRRKTSPTRAKTSHPRFFPSPGKKLFPALAAEWFGVWAGHDNTVRRTPYAKIQSLATRVVPGVGRWGQPPGEVFREPPPHPANQFPRENGP